MQDYEVEMKERVVKRPVLVRYLVAGNIFEVTEKYSLNYAIGQGAYGIVVSADDLEFQEKAAIKKIIGVFDHDFEFQKRILREIKILKHFKHENIIALTDLILPRSYKEFRDVYIVTDLMETDLRQIIKSDQTLSEQHVQYFLYQILRAIKYIHSANVLHRDLKPSNILLNSDCELKICDFGLSRGIDFDSPNPVMSTPYVATRWYRAPELLFMYDTATKAIDVWSVGCIFAELLNRKVLFQGENCKKIKLTIDLNQIEKIVDILGSPKQEHIKGCQKAKNYMKNLQYRSGADFKKLFPNVSSKAIDLLLRMLHYDPDQRITIDEALKHPYLEHLHDEDDEPTCEQFDFEFESKVTQYNIKDYLYNEVVEWNTYNNYLKGDAIIKTGDPKKIEKKE